ncbi:MAG: histidinol dehydrogenase [Nitrospirae bacterium]|nr:MAG: histidinol dehydrogenase [Nitrospirota bacterium]
MRIIKTKKDLSEFLGRLRQRSSGVNASIEKTVREILLDVSINGDGAVLKYTRKFDFKKAAKLRLSPAEIKKAAAKAEPRIVKALEISAKRIRRYHERQIEKSWTLTDAESVLGQAIRPISRAGVYVPGGKAAYPSTVLMNVIPAQVAGVKEIALCVPSGDGEINPYVMAAVSMLGVSEVYCIGGAQAVGAMAYGTETIKKVDKIVGPGNIYVALAKKIVFGHVDIDMIAGPSEILIIADDSANAAFIAADLLGQAEHDELASSVLITDSAGLAGRVAEELKKQLARLKRRKIAEKAVEAYGAIIITKKISEALSLANEIAPEHLELMTEDPMTLLPLVENAGAIFLGPWTPEALGDYAAGPNHTLPTGGTSRFFSPLGVYDFYKRSSVIGFTKKGFAKLAPVVEAIADIEGLEAHANTIRIRRSRIVMKDKTKTGRK